MSLLVLIVAPVVVGTYVWTMPRAPVPVVLQFRYKGILADSFDDRREACYDVILQVQAIISTPLAGGLDAR